MLDWLGGAPIGQDHDEEDAPGTPAPVFAARALKSAFFGTPKADETILPSQDHPTSNIEARLKSTTYKGQEVTTRAFQQLSESDIESPTKPQGILRTPGTATTKRKTVVFGGDVKEHEGKKGTLGKSGLPNDFPGKFPSPWTPKFKGEELAPPNRATSLSKLLEESREKGKPKTDGRRQPFKHNNEADGEHREPVEDVKTKLIQTGTILQRNEVLMAAVAKYPDQDGDMTFDLNAPHSQSGQYWKSEYERYHHEAREEMRKLVKYKQLAKSYAKKKDGEALILREKLKDEQYKVAVMEQRLSQLAQYMAANRLSSNSSEEPDLVHSLELRSALAMQHKDEVDNFDLAVQGQKDNDKAETASPRTSQTIHEVGQELKKARDQVREMHCLRSDLHNLKLMVSAAEKKASRLSDDNAKLLLKLQNTKDDLRKSEERRHVSERHSQEQGKKYDDMKKLAKSKRIEAEMLLFKSHDEKTALRKQLRDLKRNFQTADNELPISVRVGKPGSERVAEKLMGIKVPSNPLQVDLASLKQPLQFHSRGNSGLEAYKNQKENIGLGSNENAVFRNRQARNKSHFVTSSGSPSREKASRPSSSALSEITNNFSSPTSQPHQTVHTTPVLQEKFSKLSIRPALPDHAVESPLYSGGAPTGLKKDTSSDQSPRQRLSNGAEGHSEAVAGRPILAEKHSKAPISIRSSPLRNSPRKTLAPDRAAAAKARLQQRNLERTRAQERADQSALRERQAV